MMVWLSTCQLSLEPWPSRQASVLGLISFDDGGTNCHLVNEWSVREAWVCQRQCESGVPMTASTRFTGSAGPGSFGLWTRMLTLDAGRGAVPCIVSVLASLAWSLLIRLWSRRSPHYVMVYSAVTDETFPFTFCFSWNLIVIFVL